MSAVDYDGLEVDLDPDIEDVVIETPRHPALARALDAVRQASADLHTAAIKLPMPIGLVANDLLRDLARIEYRLEDLERQPC